MLERAAPYRHYLTSQAVALWGTNPPLSLFAGQIHQESAWDPTARSAYACGLTQFTPETAKWIAQVYRVDVGTGHCLDSRWAIRAMLRYDKHLYDLIQDVRSDCDAKKWMLSAYNGGLGWVHRDRARAKMAGADHKSYEAVAPFNSGRAPHFFVENRDYPKKIVQHQKWYEDWGGYLTCKEEVYGIQRSKGMAGYELSGDPWRCAGVDRLVCRMATLRHGP